MGNALFDGFPFGPFGIPFGFHFFVNFLAGVSSVHICELLEGVSSE